MADKSRHHKKQKNQSLKFSDRLIDLLTVFEKHRFSFLTAFIWILFLSFIRMWTEAVILDYPYKELSYEFIFYHAQIIGFFISVFIGGVLIIKLYSKRPLLDVINLACIGFTLSLIPPFLDVIFHSGSVSYTYIDPNNFISAFTTFFLSQQGSGGVGVFIELLMILLATSTYVFLRTKNLVRTILNFFTFYVFILLMGTPFLIFYIGELAGKLVQPFLVIRYLSVSLLLFFLLFLISKKGLLKSLVKSMRLLTTSHFVLMTVVGVFIAGHLNKANQFTMNMATLFDPPFWSLFTGNIAMFILTLFSIAFCWQYAVMINHVYDTSIDKKDNKKRIIPQGFMDENQVKQLAIIFAIICLGLAFLVSIYAFILMAIGIFFGTIYSVPPIRLRDGVFSTMIIGIGSSIAFFLGYYTPQYVKQAGETATGLVRNYPVVTNDAIVIGALIFIALTIGPLIKDYKDYQGDKSAGVKNLFTIYGIEKGVKITSILLPVPFICLIILFNTLIDIIILLPLGLLACFLFYKMRNTKLVFAIYFPVILYCLFRWFEIITF